MPTDHRIELAKIRSFPSLVRYLREEMDWPIQVDDFDELTFEYSAEELGIDPANAAKIQEIRRLRPLSAGQPWGIFFIKFEPKRLPVVALRRILSRVVVKKRAAANKSERTAWEAGDLLFISTFGDGNERQISFAHFSQDSTKADLPTLKVLGWDNLDTPLHLDDVAASLTDRLAWPEDEYNVEEWRETWRSAFTLRHLEVITTSEQLSIRLAKFARAICDRIKTALAIETERGPLTRLMKAFQKALIHDLDAEDFADMYAQTIAYGLLSARIADPKSKTVDHFAAHMRTNPFLKELMETFLHIGGRHGKAGGPGIDFDELGVSEVVELLDAANMEAVVRDFGNRKREEDPVIHFYELFLKEYDPKKRMQRGVFYTPQPVVSYIVRSAHELLQTEFGLPDGLADTTTWGEMVSKTADLKIPAGTKRDDPFVKILDPAVGTATFLVEVIDLIHRTLSAKWTQQRLTNEQQLAAWNDYVSRHLLPRLHGYELMMAPYAIAHMKIGLKLYETGYRFDSDERARIYLTNALEPPHDFSDRLAFDVPALALEAHAVNVVKRDQRFTVVIGNPPYANYSANLSPSARRIVDKYRTFHAVPIRERNQLQFERNIQDDFVKFLSIGEDIIQSAGLGLISYITNGTMLASTSLRGMREHFTHGFCKLYELNLHGGVNEIIAEAEDDENVFDIAQAVAIHIYLRCTNADSCQVNYAELLGPRPGKYAALAAHSVATTTWRAVQPDAENCSFMPHDDGSSGAFRRLDTVFAKFGAGIKTNRDAVAIGFDDYELFEAVGEFDKRLVTDKRRPSPIYPLLYRPFDVRRIFYHEDVVASRSLPTMKHVIAGPNIGIIASSTWTTPERFSVNVARTMVEMKTGTHDRGTTFFPLYRYENLLGKKAQPVPNLTGEFVSEWNRVTRTRLVSMGSGDLDTTSGPEDILFWLYGLFHSPEYRRRYRAALASRFPIVLLTSDKQLLRALVRVGGELAALHLLESARLNEHRTQFVGRTNSQVEKVSWSHLTVWIDKAQTIGFKGVGEDEWSFHIGGYRVCEKWLKDRKGRTLSKDDIAHYQKIVVALAETIRLMKEIDETIDKHGGWPGAFDARTISRSCDQSEVRVEKSI